MREYEKVVLSADFIGVHEITHRYYLVSGLGRTRDLLKILEYERPESALIFCNTRDDTAVVASFLVSHGHHAEAISSDLTQSDRERVMGLMRAKELKFLVATDIAARGIDLSGLPYVINYMFPESPEVYIHRTGRTGRAGALGTAISLIGPREIGSFYYLKLLYKIRPEERELPTEGELRTRREGERYARLAAEVGEEPGEEWRALARRVWESAEGERLVAALVKRHLEGAPAVIAPRIEGVAARPEREVEKRREHEPRGRRDERGERGRREKRGRDEGRRDTGRSEVPTVEERPARKEPPRPAGPPREFWETWVDEKTQEPAAPGEKAAAPAPAGERPPRPRRDRGEREVLPEEPGYVRLYVNVGKREGLSPEDITRIAVEAAPEQQPALGKVLVLGTHSYLSVKEEAAQAVANAMTGKMVGEREIVVERAKR